MKKYNYIIFTFFWVICGSIYGLYDNYLMEQELKDLTVIDYNTSINVKKKSVRLFRDGRIRILNDSICVFLGIDSFDKSFDLSDNWGLVDSLIKDANSDTLKCILYSGEVKYLEVDNPANDDGW